jgi:hypothetical protein
MFDRNLHRFFSLENSNELTRIDAN